ncbi:MAG: hypothetical protein ACOY3X_11030 [Pseudomonadota bacterium]
MSRFRRGLVLFTLWVYALQASGALAGTECLHRAHDGEPAAAQVSAADAHAGHAGHHGMAMSDAGDMPEPPPVPAAGAAENAGDCCDCDCSCGSHGCAAATGLPLPTDALPAAGRQPAVSFFAERGPLDGHASGLLRPPGLS